MKEVTLEQMKEFALSKIYPYYAGLKPFGYDAIAGRCVYKNAEGNCCIAGAEMLPEAAEHWADLKESIVGILERKTQADIFRPESVGILSDEKWGDLQFLHDILAKQSTKDMDEENVVFAINCLGLFTYEELVNYKPKEISKNEN